MFRARQEYFCQRLREIWFSREEACKWFLYFLNVWMRKPGLRELTAKALRFMDQELKRQRDKD